MKRRTKQIVSAVVSLLLLFTVFSGCTSKTASPAPAASAAPAASTASAANALPLTDKPVKLTYWVALATKIAQVAPSYSQVPGWAEAQKLTGVTIQFIHPPVGQEAEQFNLMVSSNDLPDLIGYGWNSTYPGGATKAAKDGVIMNLTDLMKKNAPNITAAFAAHPDWKKASYSLDGSIYAFPFGRVEPMQAVTTGISIRKDWLDKLGLKPPATMDDWTNVLTAFREKDPNGNGKKDEVPISGGNHIMFKLAYDLTTADKDQGFLILNGKVTHNALQPTYKDYLTMMNKWYKAGIIDPEYPTVTDTKTKDAKVLNDLQGAFWGGPGGGFIGKYISAKRKAGDNNFTMLAMLPPAGPDGKQWMQKDPPVTGPNTGISAKSKNAEIAVKFLDWFWSEKGSNTINLGVEGDSYVIKDGKPQFTDKIVKNTEGLAFDLAEAKYGGMCVEGGPFIQSPLYQITSYREFPEQQFAADTWAKGYAGFRLAPVAPLPEDASEVSRILKQVTTYIAQMEDKFIMGLEPMDKYDDYIKTLKGMEIEKAVSLYQKAYDAYNKN